MRLRLLTTLSCVALVVAGCGGDSGGSDPTPADLTVQMTEYRFEPGDATVSPGATIRVTNEGEIAHNLKVERGPDPKDETQELAGTDSFLPGDAESFQARLPRGRYAMVCTVPGHRELGMTGTFRVE